jgi:hypothetical protein
LFPVSLNSVNDARAKQNVIQQKIGIGKYLEQWENKSYQNNKHVQTCSIVHLLCTGLWKKEKMPLRVTYSQPDETRLYPLLALLNSVQQHSICSYTLFARSHTLSSQVGHSTLTLFCRTSSSMQHAGSEKAPPIQHSMAQLSTAHVQAVVVVRASVPFFALVASSIRYTMPRKSMPEWFDNDISQVRLVEYPSANASDG